VRCRRTGIGFPKTRQAAKVNLRRVPFEEPGYVRRLRAVRHAAIATQARRIVHPMSDGASANVMRVGEVSPRATCRRKFRDYNKFICINRSSPAWGPCVRLPRGWESKRGASHHVGVELLLRHRSNANRQRAKISSVRIDRCSNQKIISMRKNIDVNASETECIAGDD
jgi:hypothetical protein